MGRFERVRLFGDVVAPGPGAAARAGVGGRCHRLTAAAALLTVLALPAPAPAQRCDEALIDAPADTLAYRLRGQRCEGFYRADVSEPMISLVGVMRGPLYFDPAGDERVTLSAAVDPAVALSVRVRPFPLKTYYQMDAALPPGGSLDWPLDVVRASGLSPDWLSVAAWFDSGNGPVYVPVRAVADGAAAGDDATRLFFRSNATLEYFQHEWKGGERTYRSPPSPRTAPPGRPLVVTLPGDLTGRVAVTVAGRVRGAIDRWVAETVIVFLGEP